MNVPIIRLELEGMKQTLAVALHQYTLQIDQDIQAAIASYCTTDNIARVIKEQVRRSLDRIVTEEVDKFFAYGDGRKVVSVAVNTMLKGVANGP